jgi:hypothetical protein
MCVGVRHITKLRLLNLVNIILKLVRDFYIQGIVKINEWRKIKQVQENLLILLLY